MDFSYSAAETAFREEIRGWIGENVRGNFGRPEWPILDDERGSIAGDKEDNNNTCSTETGEHRI